MENKLTHFFQSVVVPELCLIMSYTVSLWDIMESS